MYLISVYLRVEKLVKLRRNEVQHTITGTWQSYRSHKQHSHNDIWEYGQEIRCLSSTLNSSDKDQGYTDPCESQAQNQLPVRHTDSVGNGVFFLENFVAIMIKSQNLNNKTVLVYKLTRNTVPQKSWFALHLNRVPSTSHCC